MLAAGWGLMLLILFSMLLSVGHNLAMILVTIIMLTEHMGTSRVPKWEINFSLKFCNLYCIKWICKTV